MIQRSHQENTEDIYLLNNAVVELKEHARISNDEVGKIKIEIGIIKTEIQWIKETLSKFDARIWFVLTGVILGILLQILFNIIKLK